MRKNIAQYQKLNRVDDNDDVLDHGSVLYNRLFSDELSEAELACLLIVFIITAMSQTRSHIPIERTRTGDQDKN